VQRTSPVRRSPNAISSSNHRRNVQEKILFSGILCHSCQLIIVNLLQVLIHKASNFFKMSLFADFERSKY
jgi:hypothetical protein